MKAVYTVKVVASKCSYTVILESDKGKEYSLDMILMVVIFNLDVFVHNQSKKIGGMWQCKNIITLKKTQIKLRSIVL